MLTKRSTLYLYFIILVVLTSSCSLNKFLPQDKTLFTGAEININADEDKEISELKSKLNSAIKRNANSTFLGMRPGLFIILKPKKKSWFHQ